MKILYNKPGETREFDMAEYLDSLHEFDDSITRKQVEKGLEHFRYNPLHHSCLVELGVSLIKDENKAREYFEKHRGNEQGFERLRRITGYLVGDLSRWNDGKKAEEKARVKHNVDGYDNLAGQYSQDQKAEIEHIKLENSLMSQI